MKSDFIIIIVYSSHRQELITFYHYCCYIISYFFFVPSLLLGHSTCSSITFLDLLDKLTYYKLNDEIIREHTPRITNVMRWKVYGIVGQGFPVLNCPRQNGPGSPGLWGWRGGKFCKDPFAPRETQIFGPKKDV